MSVWADVDTSIGTLRVEASEATLTGSDLKIGFRIEPKARDYTIRSMTMHLGDQTGECPGVEGRVERFREIVLHQIVGITL
jgi:hypothetical protein